MSECVFLEWDSQFFRRRIGRLTTNRLTVADLHAAEQWAKDQRIDCLYFLASIDDPETVRLASAHRFELMDLRMTYERQNLESAGEARTRPARIADLSALQSIARGTFLNTRFYRDPRFAPRADALYEIWVERALSGFADAVLVAEDNAGGPAGFVCCHRREKHQGEIGLTAVRADLRGRGLGSALVMGAQSWFREQELTSAFVVTNGANIHAQRLYQRHGFVSSHVQLWYHRWFAAS